MAFFKGEAPREGIPRELLFEREPTATGLFSDFILRRGFYGIFRRSILYSYKIMSSVVRMKPVTEAGAVGPGEGKLP